MTADVTPSRPAHAGPRGRLAVLIRRWPVAVGLLAALALLLTGPAAREELAMIVLIAVSCYLAAAAFSRPWMAWAWCLPGSVLVVAARVLDVSPVLVTALAAAALVLVGLARGAARPPLARQTAGFVGYGLLVLAALALGPGSGLVLAALTLVGHGAWDVWHLLRHRDDISPSLAEACVALDIPLGLAALALAFLA